MSTMWDDRHVALLTRAAELNMAERNLHALFGGREGDMGLWERLNVSAKVSAFVTSREDEGRDKVSSTVKASQEYEVRLEASRRAYSAIYTRPLLKALDLVAAGDASGAEELLVFLEADPWCFRSGYMKQKILQHIRKVKLAEHRFERLQAALIVSIRAGRRTEFREACKTARTFDSDHFRRQLRFLRDGWHGPGTRERAGWMLAAMDRK